MLRQLVMAEMNSQNVAAANQVNKQVQSNLAAQAMFSAPASRWNAGLSYAMHRSPPPQP